MFIVSHYKSNYDWVKEYCDSFVVYHKNNINVGYNISSMLAYIIDNYDHLPEGCVFVKDNLFERHIPKEQFDRLISLISKRNLLRWYTPLLSADHKTDGTINFYGEDGMYNERNDSWYFNSYPSKYFKSYNEFADIMGLPKPDYIPFAPGGNYIVPRENILKRSKEFYQKLLDFVSWSTINAESHAVERALHTIWS